MNFGIDIATLGDYANPNKIVQLALAAEKAGWDGLFVWDHLAFVWNVAAGDPVVILSAVAQATERLRLGPMVTPLPRRRPQVVAHTLATLDVLSNGRVIFGAGLGGVAAEFAAFGEPDGARQRAAMLDEGLELLNQLWCGESVTHQGSHYTVNGVSLAPLPKQQPRIPIWIGGDSPPALRRAARWDGWVMGGEDEHGNITMPPAQLATKAAYIQQHRASDAPHDIAITGWSAPEQCSLAREYADAGATWWLESLHGLRFSFADMMARVQAGPPAT